MVQRRVNGLQQYIRKLKKVIIEAKKLKIPRVIKPAVQEIKAKPRILLKEDI